MQARRGGPAGRGSARPRGRGRRGAAAQLDEVRHDHEVERVHVVDGGGDGAHEPRSMTAEQRVGHQLIASQMWVATAKVWVAMVEVWEP